MPELPEVETIARYLHRETAGFQIAKVRFLRSDLREPIPTRDFGQSLRGQVIERVFRRSKYLLLAVEGGAMGVFHLGMTGNLLLEKSARPSRPHTHMVLSLKRPPAIGAPTDDDELHLHYVDPRRFGRISVAASAEAWVDHPFARELGREPLVGRQLGNYLWQASRRRQAPIKNFLMDAKVVVGVGNIYACEALFRAGIHPERPAASLDATAYESLVLHLRQTLREAIKAGGTSFRDFKDVHGQPGYFKLALQVYGRKGEACRSCGNPIMMLRQAGRSTWYCAVCQV